MQKNGEQRRQRKRGSRSRFLGNVSKGSLATAVVAAVVNDLRQPDSIIKKTLSFGRRQLLALREQRKAVDISDVVEAKVVRDETSTNN